MAVWLFEVPEAEPSINAGRAEQARDHGKEIYASAVAHTSIEHSEEPRTHITLLLNIVKNQTHIY